MEYGLIGERLGHSYSPEIHAKIADYNYQLVEIENEKLGDFLKERNFKAINVTIPYKQTVIPMLDDISENARSIGAVNTIVNRAGKLYGYNTDFSGMLAQFRNMKCSLKDKKVLILGTGGTSKTARAVAQSMGAKTILNVSRSGQNGAITYSEAVTCHADANIIINTTPAGMYPDIDGKAIELRAFRQLEGVLDAVYHPLRTNLVQEARGMNICSAGGLYMLAAQAVYASALFTDTQAQDDNVANVYRAVLREKQNIVLIGMPSCGKTQVGRVIAQKLNIPFVDTDDEVISIIKMPIADYFVENGEGVFRKMESKVIRKTAEREGCVIATGGGAILNPDNVRLLKHNGYVIFIDRSPEKLIVSDDRPLSSDRAALMKRYEERYPIYMATADAVINGNGTIEETADIVLQEVRK